MRLKCAYGENLETAISTLYEIKELLNGEIYQGLKRTMPDNKSLFRLSHKINKASLSIDEALVALGGLDKIDLQF